MRGSGVRCERLSPSARPDQQHAWHQGYEGDVASHAVGTPDGAAASDDVQSQRVNRPGSGGDVRRSGRMGFMSTPRKYDPELRARPVRMYAGWGSGAALSLAPMEGDPACDVR